MCASVRITKVAVIPTSSPNDVSGLQAEVERGTINPSDIVAILGKTEGNGCVNDFTRGYSTDSLTAYLTNAMGITAVELHERVAIVMSGGTEGGLCPHLMVFSVTSAPSVQQQEAGQVGRKSMAIGVGFTRDFLPEEQGTAVQVEETAKAVSDAMKQASITSTADVHYVQIKCPLLTKERIAAAKGRGAATATTDTLASMGYSRGASALGVAVALGEVQMEALQAQDICSTWAKYSSVASTSAGIELLRNEVMVMGNSSSWAGELVMSHDVMQDAIDVEAARRALAQVGITPAGQLTAAQRSKVVTLLAKAESARGGVIRGRRHVMLDDSDIAATRHARALVGGVLAGLLGDTCLYVSGGAEHQGPDGGGPVAVIARKQGPAIA